MWLVNILVFLLFSFGFWSSGFLPAFGMVKENSPPGNNATALGFMNTLNNLGGAFLQPLIGFILDMLLVAGGKAIKISSAAQFKIALATIPGCIVLAMLFLPLIKETYCKEVYQPS